jgi:hypothetical protein
MCNKRIAKVTKLHKKRITKNASQNKKRTTSHVVVKVFAKTFTTSLPLL